MKDPILSRPIVKDGKVTITTFGTDTYAKEYANKIKGRYVDYGRKIIIYPSKTYSGDDGWGVGYKVSDDI